MNDKETKEVKVEEVSLNDVATDTAAPLGADYTDDVDTMDAAPDTASGDNAEMEKITAELAEMRDKYLRLAAELENTRRRAALDTESSARTRAMSVVRNFLPVMDAIAAALSHSPDDAGILSMSRAMDAAFDQVGIKKIASVGVALNPQFHNAIQVVPAENGATPNTIAQEMQTGYMFGDVVLRPAMVVVYK